MEGSKGSITTRPLSISVRMSLSESSTLRGYVLLCTSSQSCPPRHTRGAPQDDSPAPSDRNARSSCGADRALTSAGTELRIRPHFGHLINRPGPSRPAPRFCNGNELVLNRCPSAQRTTVRSSIDPLPTPTPTPHPRPSQPRPATVTLGDLPDIPTPPRRTTPTLPDRMPTPLAGWGNMLHDRAVTDGSSRGRSLMVEHELPKLIARVRFSSPAQR